MGIAEEIDVLHIFGSLLLAFAYSVKSQFDPRFFAHHRLVPCWFEDQVDGSTLDAIDGLNLRAYIF